MKTKKDAASVSFFCGWRWIRTTEGVSQQIYSLPHLATLVSTLEIILIGLISVQIYRYSLICARKLIYLHVDVNEDIVLRSIYSPRTLNCTSQRLKNFIL